MTLRPVSAEFAAILTAAGFERHLVADRVPLDVYRRSAHGSFVIEARQDRGGHLDLGLTVPTPGAGALVGPVHRALSVEALAAGLEHIVDTLRALSTAAESLRCPDCKALRVLAEDGNGPFLACGEVKRGRRAFDGAVRRCRSNLVMAPLVLYRDPVPDEP